MRVARIEEFGGPDVLRVAEEPRPEPGDNEILIEIRSAGINRADVLTRGGYHAALNDTWEWIERDLTLVTVPGAGHFVQQDAADFVTRTMKSWLSR